MEEGLIRTPITAAMLEEARARWAAGPLGVAKAPPKCALCKRERGDHQAKTLCCPLGQRHRTLGFTTFDPDQSYTEKAPRKLATPRKARGKGKGAGLTPDAPQEAPEAAAGQAAPQPELPIDSTKREAWERGELTLAEAQQGPVEGEAALVVGSYCGTGDRE